MTDIIEYLRNNRQLSPQLLEEVKEQLELTPEPSRKTEAWKYFPVKSLDWTPLSKALDKQAAKEQVADHQIEGLKKLVFINGAFNEELSDFDSSLVLSSEDYNFNKDDFESTVDIMSLYSSQAGYDLNITESGTYHVVQITTEGSSFIRNRLVLSEGVEAKIIETVVLSSESKFFTYSDWDLSKGSKLTYYSNSQCPADSLALLNLNLRVQEKAVFESLVLDTDPGVLRRRMNVDLLGEHSHADFKGFYLLNKKAKVNYKLNVNHLVPNCTSNQLFKGILDDRASVSFDGTVFVEKQAQGTDSQQLNKSTLLSNTAEVNTRPQLEIYADDVACAHGATLGGFSQDEVFYLQSRAIPYEKAVQMIAFGFAEDILKDIKIEKVHEKFSAQFIDRFSQYEVEVDV